MQVSWGYCNGITNIISRDIKWTSSEAYITVWVKVHSMGNGSHDWNILYPSRLRVTPCTFRPSLFHLQPAIKTGKHPNTSKSPSLQYSSRSPGIERVISFLTSSHGCKGSEVVLYGLLIAIVNVIDRKLVRRLNPMLCACVQLVRLENSALRTTLGTPFTAWTTSLHLYTSFSY